MKIVANFKTNHTHKSTCEYIKELENFLKTHKTTSEVEIFPPFTAFVNSNDFLNIKLGAQNFYPIKNGSVTGEIGLEQLNEFKIDSVLIGHSERRTLLKENQEIVSNKFNFAKENNFEIIYCIGEPLEIREKGINFILEYLFGQFDGIDINYAKLVVAYEPIWAIGSGKSATTKDIDEVLNALKEKIKAPLLYGGSVNIDNVASIVSLKNCDGVLIGNASLNVDNFCKIVEKIDSVKKQILKGNKECC